MYQNQCDSRCRFQWGRLKNRYYSNKNTENCAVPKGNIGEKERKQYSSTKTNKTTAIFSLQTRTGVTNKNKGMTEQRSEGQNTWTTEWMNDGWMTEWTNERTGPWRLLPLYMYMYMNIHLLGGPSLYLPSSRTLFSTELPFFCYVMQLDDQTLCVIPGIWMMTCWYQWLVKFSSPSQSKIVADSTFIFEENSMLFQRPRPQIYWQDEFSLYLLVVS